MTIHIVSFADGSLGPRNKPCPIDQAWETRVPLAWRGRPTIQQEIEQEREAAARPFRFEDLNGEPEPEKWGPVYNLSSASLEKWRKLSRGRELTVEENAAYGAAVHAAVRSANAPRKAPNTLPTSSNCASGQPTTFSAAKHRAKIIGELRSAVARDRLAWATSKGIVDAYKAAMAAKRNREAVDESAFVEAARIAKAFGRPLTEAA